MAEEIEIGKEIVPFIKKHWKVILIFAIFVLAFWVRAYHMDYPVVGYHNWKEAHYLTEARNFANDGFFSNGFFVPEYDYPKLGENSDGAHSDSFPTLSILLGFLFMIFGESLVLARFVVAFFNAFTIVFMYLLVKELFKREDLAFLSAFLYAINPLTGFFSHNVQLINLAIFFMVAGAYFFVRWKVHDKDRDLVLASVLLALAILTKYTFVVIAVPVALLFPWARLKRIKVNWKPWLVGIVLFAFIGVWFLYSNYYLPSALGVNPAVGSGLFGFEDLTDSGFWQVMKSFFADNFTLFGMWFVGLGALGLMLMYKKNLGYKFMLFYILGTLIWLPFMTDKLRGHNYHQYPIVPLFVFLIAFAFLIIGSNVGNILSKFVKFKWSKILFKYLAILVLVFLLWGPTADALNRQRDTQFFGLDIAGNYIAENALPGDKMFHSSHQSHGVLWYSGMKGYPLPDSIEMLDEAEANGVRWMFIYQWGFSVTQNPELWSRIQSTYSVGQYGFLMRDGQPQSYYLVLEKGGSFSDQDINNRLQEVQPSVVDYELSGGNIPFYYINF
tara:strand:+ start:3003 stop:4670 length:1668 start_codon:yes stop_codon:yes gene_type:complete